MTRRFALLVALPLLVGCGTEAAPPAGDDGSDGSALAGEYLSDGLPAPYGDGDQLRVTFGEGEVSFSATCNQMSGTADWSGAKLEVSSVGGTEMGCPGRGFAQDEWLVDFFTSRPSLTVDGTDVLLGTPEAEIWLVPADEVAPEPGPDVALKGTRWELTGIEEQDGDSASMLVIPPRVDAWLEVADEQLSFRAGCNGGGGPVEVDGDRLVMGEIVIQLVGCRGVEAEIEWRSVRVLMADAADWSVSGDELRLTRHDRTLVYRAR